MINYTLLKFICQYFIMIFLNFVQNLVTTQCKLKIKVIKYISNDWYNCNIRQNDLNYQSLIFRTLCLFIPLHFLILCLNVVRWAVT